MILPDMSGNNQNEMNSTKLKRALSLPWLVLYGLGVTIGAGIFALIGEIVGLAGDGAALSFLVAGLIAGATGISYALLVSVIPKAGGEAVFINRGLGPALGRIAGIGVALTGIISSAAISLAFAGYAGTLFGIPDFFLVLSLLMLLTFIAWFGIRESVAFAGVITILEVGTLVVVIFFGAPFLDNLPPTSQMVAMDEGFIGLVPVLSGALIAFFAFIGFEDIENMAEETINPSYTAPRAIIWTLVLTVIVYVALALVAISIPQRTGLTQSPAPLSFLYEQVTGWSGKPVSVIAAFAMINGILVQIVMSSRVLYGMANEGLIWSWFGKVDTARQTPARATFVVSAIIFLLAVALPLITLAEITSLIVLSVFALVNLSLFSLGKQQGSGRLYQWRYWGIFGAILCLAILLFSIFSGQLAH
ncbi:MAG: APC family permease [Rhizobiaceae bacterium]